MEGGAGGRSTQQPRVASDEYLGALREQCTNVNGMDNNACDYVNVPDNGIHDVHNDDNDTDNDVYDADTDADSSIADANVAKNAGNDAGNETVQTACQGSPSARDAARNRGAPRWLRERE